MSFEQTAIALVRALELYLVAGAIFAPLFALRGVEKVDPAAHGASWGFRLIILPGAMALWPLLLVRWVRGTPPPAESNAHRRAAGSAR